MPHPTVVIIGSGTMGAGIAQVAATAGWSVELMDVDEATARGAIEGIEARLDRLVEKGRLTRADRDAAAGRLGVGHAARGCGACDLLLEAIVEDLDAKVAALRAFAPGLRDDAIIATNTSSLSVSALGEAVGQPRRTVGMHFFNPAPLMQLVEVVAGDRTEPAVVDRVATIAEAWGKRVARAADVPGFIVNHVARPYYLEAFRILEDGLADPETIDEAMRRLGGFRMGPLELTDLIGQDVNAATTRSVWEQLDHPPLLRPSPLQERLVADGHLGRKTGHGVYDYGGERPRVAIATGSRPLRPGRELADAVEGFVRGTTDERGSEVEAYVLARIGVALIAQACAARARGVAGPADIDTAMRFGVNYPLGPFQWSAQVGADVCRRLLRALDETVDDDRFVAVELTGATSGS
jgi:3-hydroxybutyryl-CoA dehydrogenase